MKVFSLLVIANLFLIKSTFAASTTVEIEMWLRRPGVTSSSDAKFNLQKIDLKGMTFDELNTMDIQYGVETRVRGMHLRDLIAAYKPLPLSATMLLLHSANGMVIPLSIPRLRTDRQVFIALETFKNKAWTSQFPSSIRPDPTVKDEHIINFNGNKLVVGSDWRATESTFTPWRHFDTLVGIEFAEETPYNEQFATTQKSLDQTGRGIFLARCQFCHGLKGVGAKKAPDIQTIITGDDKNSIEKLYQKVAVPKPTYEQLTHAMPKQTNFTKGNAKQLAKWIKAIIPLELKPYTPSFTEQEYSIEKGKNKK